MVDGSDSLVPAGWMTHCVRHFAAGVCHRGIGHWLAQWHSCRHSGTLDGTVAQWTLASRVAHSGTVAGTRSDKPQITKQQQAGAVAVRRERTRLQDKEKVLSS